MRPSSGSRRGWLALAFLYVGCSSTSETEQDWTPVPDSAVGRSMAKFDAALEVGTGDHVGGSDAADVAMDGSEAGGGDAPSLRPSITVEVDPQSLVPARDGGVTDPLIAPSTSGPSPFVTVTVVSNTGDLKLDDVASVTAAIFEPAGTTAISTTKLARSDARIVPESNTMQFVFSGVPLDLSKLASASYLVVFTATTVGGDTGQTKVTLAVDSGPTLTVKLPVEKGYYKGSAPVEVQATQSKFAIVRVTMALGQGEEKPLTPVGAGLYKGNIDFAAYSPPLEGAQLATFRATNENGTTFTVLRNFTSDNDGPTIGSTKPGIGSMVGNVISIEATVDDPAGVDDSSVIAVVGNGDQTFEVVLAPLGGKLYSSLFDTTKLPSHALYPTISFRARDRLGNESTTSYMLSLDNEPPLMDLDPAYVRMFRENDGVCSWPFDPVGPDAVDDGDMVTQLFDVRARVEDRGNKPLTGNADFVLIGGIAAPSVKLYVLGNASRPLVVDTSEPADGVCDQVNPELVPTTKPQTDLDAQVLDMLALGPNQGTPDYTPNTDSSCSAPIPTKEPPFPPAAFCSTTANPSKGFIDEWGHLHSHNMTYVMSYSSGLPAIYTLGPIGKEPQCAGRQFDASNNLKNGWACLAVKASDTLGNTQVSRPIRVCVVSDPSQKGCADLRKLARLMATSPIEIVTSEPFLIDGAPLAAGTSILISGVKSDPSANGRWKIDPVPSDATGTRYTLRGSAGSLPSVCACTDQTCMAYTSCQASTLHLTPGQPIVVETVAEHGFTTGDVVEISGNTEQAGVEGIPWGVNVVNATQFSLVNSVATEPVSPEGAMFVVVEKMPDCTGTLVKGGTDGGRPVVDGTQPCRPWTEKDEFIHRD